jgi:hypothetical protein
MEGNHALDNTNSRNQTKYGSRLEFIIVHGV